MSVKHTPPEKKTLGQISLSDTKAGGGEQSVLLHCMAKARGKGETPVRFFGRLAMRP